MSTWYRRNACLRKGHKEYTNCGFQQAKKKFISDDLDVDCSEKHYLITGSNRGIGLETAVEIAKRGGVVHLLCRNRASMLEARSHIITTTGNDRLHLHTLDLSRPRDVGRWAQDFVSTHEQLDVLINNAGFMSAERTTDDDGIETTFAVNTLSVHLLTIILLPLLQRSKEPRVINVTSSDLLQVKLDSDDFYFENLQPFDGYQAYAQTKRQQAVMTTYYAQRYERVRFYCTHPGWVDTKLLKRSQPEFYSLMQNSLRTPNQGADTVVWLSVSETALKHASGLFFQDRTPISYHLPLAWTRHTPAEEKTFMQKLDKQLALVSSYCCYLEDSSESGFDETSSNERNCVHQSCTSSSTTSQNSDSEIDINFSNQPVDTNHSIVNEAVIEPKLNGHVSNDRTLVVNELTDLSCDNTNTLINDQIISDESKNILNSEDNEESLIKNRISDTLNVIDNSEK